VILYLDTSALVKLFLTEPGSEAVRARGREAEHIATSQVTYAEAMATFARRHREGRLDAEQVQTLVTELDRLWSDVAVLAVDEIAAGRLALKHALQGFDAIHLAAALRLGQGMRPVELEFVSFDEGQIAAARDEGLMVSE